MDSSAAVKIGDRVGDGDTKNLSNIEKLAKSKKLDFAKPKTFKADFLTPGAKEAFIHLRKAFTKASIRHHFDTKCHIHIKTDSLGYAIGRVLSQMTLN